MTNWKEVFDKKVYDKLFDMQTTTGTKALTVTQYDLILDFISKEIIEKI